MPSEQSYYLSLEVEGNNVCRTDQDLVLNCAGVCVLPRPFETHIQLGREDYYLQYLVQGKMRVWLEEGEQIMEPGQAVLYYPHTGYRYAMDGREEIQYYWLHFTGSGADKLVKDCRLPNRRLLSLGSSAPIVSQFEGLFHDFILRDHCFALSAASRLLSVCVEISRRLEAAEGNRAAGVGRVYRAISHIHQNYEKKLTIPFLAELEHVSPSRFRLLFREATGLSPMDYITVLRLNHARQLMLQTDNSLGEIARAVGYPDQLYFSRVFKKRTGLTPSDYRQGLLTPAPREQGKEQKHEEL